MKTRLMVSATIPAYDEALLENLRSRDWPGEGTAFVAGFVNEEGVIFRTVMTHGLRELMELALICDKLDLVNELLGKSRIHNGCNTLWRPRDRTTEI